jgi:hypothetical protein
MASAGFDPAIPVTKLPQTYTLDSAATWIAAYKCFYKHINTPLI